MLIIKLRFHIINNLTAVKRTIANHTIEHSHCFQFLNLERKQSHNTYVIQYLYMLVASNLFSKKIITSYHQSNHTTSLSLLSPATTIPDTKFHSICNKPILCNHSFNTLKSLLLQLTTSLFLHLVVSLVATDNFTLLASCSLSCCDSSPYTSIASDK